MDKKKLVKGTTSIIIPTHNRSKILEDTLLSLNGFRNGEVIVVENGSGDLDIKGYKRLKKKFPNVIFKFLEDGNLPNARNVGIESAVSDYIFHLDDDDKPTIEFINLLNEGLFTNDVYRFNFLNGDQIVSPRWGKTFSRKWIYGNVQVSTWLVKKSFYKENKISFDIRYPFGEDQIFAYKVFKTNVKQEFIKISSIFYNFSDERESFTRADNREIMNDYRFYDFFTEDWFSRAIILKTLNYLTSRKNSSLYDFSKDDIGFLSKAFKESSKNIYHRKKYINQFLKSLIPNKV